MIIRSYSFKIYKHRRFCSMISNSFTHEPITDSEMELLGCQVSKLLNIGDTIFLRGDLGAGKTTFSRGFIREKMNDPEMIVTSPSYLLDNTYPLPYDDNGDNGILHHMDLYRLPKGFDPSLLGIPSIYENSLCLIEWPERLIIDKPESLIDIEILIKENEKRVFTLTLYGGKLNQRLQDRLDKLLVL